MLELTWVNTTAAYKRSENYTVILNELN